MKIFYVFCLPAKYFCASLSLIFNFLATSPMTMRLTNLTQIRFGMTIAIFPSMDINSVAAIITVKETTKIPDSIRRRCSMPIRTNIMLKYAPTFRIVFFKRKDVA